MSETAAQTQSNPPVRDGILLHRADNHRELAERSPGKARENIGRPSSMELARESQAGKLTQYLPRWLWAIFASAYIPVAALTTPLGVYLPHYYASHLGVSLGLVAGAFGIVRLIDIFLDSVI